MKQQLNTQEAISRILITPLLSRVNMPEYGSLLFELIDKPINDEWILDATRYTYEAIEKNEPRVSIKKVSISTGESVSINITYLENGVTQTFNIGFQEVTNAAA
ncbi:MAG TPA: baseplate assembly protein [Sulfurimonas sp. UBA12504]|nr:MAG TPA: baseplate assembly protein [Sulfurimonas sp. UBA12504]